MPLRSRRHRSLITLESLLEELDLMAVDLTALQTAVAKNTTDVAAAAAAINTLQAQVAAGGANSVDPAAIDAITASVTANNTALEAATATPPPTAG